MEHLKQVLKVLQDNQLVVNKKKCSFGERQVEYLGLYLTGRLGLAFSVLSCCRDLNPATPILNPAPVKFFKISNYPFHIIIKNKIYNK